MAAFFKHVVEATRTSSSFYRSPTLWFSTKSHLVTKYNFEFSKKSYKYILDEKLASRVAQSLGNLQDGVIIETNPGPGVLTKALFEAGATHVIGLEPERKFHPALWDLQAEVTANKRFDLLHGDFSKIDPHDGSVGTGAFCTPPAISSTDVLDSVESIPWTSDDLTARFVGIEAATNPTVLPRVLIGQLSKMAAKKGIFQKGRCELNFFYAEDRAQKITAQFGSKYFNRLSVMVSLFCDVKVLLKEPCSLFYPVRGKEKHKFLNLVSIVPKKIPAVDISSEDLHYLNYFIRLLLVKPHRKIIDAIESISPGSHVILDELLWSRDTSVRHLCPDDIGKLASAFFHWEGRSLNFYYDSGCKDELEGLKFM